MTDAELVARARHGDARAFEELVRRTGRLAFARVVLEVRDPHRAEDLVQETYLLAWRRIKDLKEVEGFRGWLLSIAGNVVIDAARKSTADKRIARPRPAPSNGDADPVLAAQRSEERDRLIDALRGLPEQYQTALSLRYLAAADYGEIERQMGITHGSLRGILHRGLGLLREAMNAAPGHGRVTSQPKEITTEKRQA